MLYTGIDLTPIDRIRKSAENPRFTARVFSAEERAYFSSLSDPFPSMAAAFAAKEAFSKVLGTGVRGFKLCEVSVLHTPLGAPFYAFSGNAARIVKERRLRFSLSLTHTDLVAAAFAAAEQLPVPAKATVGKAAPIERMCSLHGRTFRKNHSRRRNRRNRGL